MKKLTYTKLNTKAVSEIKLLSNRSSIFDGLVADLKNLAVDEGFLVDESNKGRINGPVYKENKEGKKRFSIRTVKGRGIAIIRLK